MSRNTSLVEDAPGAVFMRESPLESLPNELLDSILDYIVNHDINSIRGNRKFDYRPLSRLSQCSRFLNHRLEPLLYGTRDACNAALFHGCKTGNLNAIRKTISHGTKPGTIRIYVFPNTAADMEPNQDSREVFSLQIALKAQKFEAFELLLELGAGVGPSDCANDNVRKLQLQEFGLRLSEPCNVEFLTTFLEARRETPNWPSVIDGPSQAQMIARVLSLPTIVQWATLELLEMLINNEADVNQAALTRTDSGKELLTPLSAAALRGDSSIFHLLVARGANVNVEDNTGKYRERYTQIPSIMAAQFMAKHGDTTMVQACVDAGADIDRPCHVDTHLLAQNDSVKHVCTTPLLTYLSSIESWNTSIPAGFDGRLLATDGVAYFIHNYGAKVSSPAQRPRELQSVNMQQELHDRTFGGIPSPVELLLTKWGIKSLANPEFFAVVKLLVVHGGTGPDLARILVRFDGRNKTSTDIDLEGLWQKFLILLMPQLNSLDQNQKNALLRRVIVDKAGMHDRVAHPSQWIRVKAIGRASIDALISAGANINDISPENAEWPEMNTPLHQIISSFIHTDSLTEDCLHDHDAGYICPRTEDMARTFGEFLAFLVNRGADPFIEDKRKYREDERTAIDTLMSPMKEGRIKFISGPVEQSLMHLVARLKRTNEVLDYTGDRPPYDKGGWRNNHYSRGWHGDCKLSSEVDT